MVKRQTTKDLLAESLKELTGKMPFERITVKDIVSNCGLSATTFYHHFRDKYHLVEWTYHTDSRQFVDRICDTFTWRDAAYQTLLVFHDNLDYYRSFFRSSASVSNLNMITYAEALDTIKKLHGADSITEEIRFMLQLYLRGVSSMTVEWILKDKTTLTTEMFTDLIMQAMPDTLKKLLF